MTSQAKEPTPSVADLRPGGADLGGLWQTLVEFGGVWRIWATHVPRLNARLFVHNFIL